MTSDDSKILADIRSQLASVDEKIATLLSNYAAKTGRLCPSCSVTTMASVLTCPFAPCAMKASA